MLCLLHFQNDEQPILNMLMYTEISTESHRDIHNYIKRTETPNYRFENTLVVPKTDLMQTMDVQHLVILCVFHVTIIILLILTLLIVWGHPPLSLVILSYRA